MINQPPLINKACSVEHLEKLLWRVELMQEYKSIRLSPVSIEVIESLNANKDINDVFRRNLSLVLNDYHVVEQLLGIKSLTDTEGWLDIKNSMQKCKPESSEYTVTTVTLTSEDINIITEYSVSTNSTNFSGTINAMLEDFNTAIEHLARLPFTKKEWMVLRSCYNALPLSKLRISDEIVIASDTIYMAIKRRAGKNNRKYDRIISKLINLTASEVLVMCCQLRGMPVGKCALCR